MNTKERVDISRGSKKRRIWTWKRIEEKMEKKETEERDEKKRIEWNVRGIRKEKQKEKRSRSEEDKWIEDM